MISTRLPTVLLLAAFGLTYAGSASAAPPTKDECVEAHSRGQDAREKGQLADSKRLFLLCAQSSCPALIQSDCAKFGDELGRTVPSVSFVARDAKGGDLVDTQVYVDGVLVQSRLEEGRSHDLDPGKHTVRFAHAGKDVTQSVVISAGEKGRAIVAVFGDATASAAPARSAVSEEPAQPSRPIAPLIVAEVGRTIRRLKDEGQSIVLVEQNRQLALGVADQAVILNTGRCVFTGSAADVLNNEALIAQNLGVFHAPSSTPSVEVKP